MYVSLDAPDEETYISLCRPLDDYWERVKESLNLLGSRRSAVPDHARQRIERFRPERYRSNPAGSGSMFVEVKGYMYLGYSRKRLVQEIFPEHGLVRSFAEKIAAVCDLPDQR